RQAQAAAQRRRHHPVDGEPPLRDGGQARRRGEESPGQDHRDHQHRCRGSPDPVRRAVVPAALQAGGRDRHRHAHGRGRRGARAGRDRDDGERRGPARRSPRGGGPRGRALLAVAAVGRVSRPAQVGHRGHEELGGAGRRLDRGRLVPARIRGGLPLGAPRHRRDGVHRGRRAAQGQGSDGDRRAALHRIHPQARGGVTRGLGCAAVLLSLAAAAAAQVDTTARRDTTARDSTARRDSAAADSLPRYLPVFPAPIPPGPAPCGTRYSFTADSFALSNIQTLSDLLAHIPGVYVARGGIYGAPEPVLYGGRGPAGLELFWDGVPYLPLGRDSLYLDPARISLAPLERVDVVVLPASLRVYLVTLRQRSTATASQVGVASGEISTANYRGAYLRRWRSGLGLSLVADYNNNDGVSGTANTPFNSVDLWLKAEYVPT